MPAPSPPDQQWLQLERPGNSQQECHLLPTEHKWKEHTKEGSVCAAQSSIKSPRCSVTPPDGSWCTSCWPCLQSSPEPCRPQQESLFPEIHIPDLSQAHSYLCLSEPSPPLKGLVFPSTAFSLPCLYTEHGAIVHRALGDEWCYITACYCFIVF